MKRLLSFILALSMVFTMFPTALAQSNNEQTLIEINTDIGLIKVTGIEDASGNISMFEYRDGKLAIMTRYTRGDTYYERFEVSQGQSRSAANWEVVNFSDAIAEVPPVITPFAHNTRHIGYMHYNNQIIGEIYSIKCHVDEWYLPDKIVTVSGTFGSLIDFIQFLAGAVGISIGIASKVADGLITALIIHLVSGAVKTLVSTDVTANVIEQRIYGVSTSHSGRPVGDLGDGKITYVTSSNPKYKNKTFYEGYTTHLWGTSGLGRMMFWKVFGIEVIPTSWTGVDG